jgi:hypothetical protein
MPRGARRRSAHVVVRVIWYRRARPTTNGVASAHGSQEINSVPKSGSQTRCGCSFCRTRTVRLASTNAAAHQIAAIQSKRVERAVRFMTLILHHRGVRGSSMLRTARPVQQAVWIGPVGTPSSGARESRSCQGFGDGLRMVSPRSGIIPCSRRGHLRDFPGERRVGPTRVRQSHHSPPTTPSDSRSGWSPSAFTVRDWFAASVR